MAKRQLLLLLIGLLSAGGAMAGPDAVLQLLDKKSCSGCNLQGADLIYAELQSAQLPKAKLQGANLGRANLSNANLRGADLTDASLQGANLHRADLRGAKLKGTDLRSADLTDARLDPEQLASSHTEGAKGITAQARSYAELHNAGVKASLAAKHPEALVKRLQKNQKLPSAGWQGVLAARNRAEMPRLQQI